MPNLPPSLKQRNQPYCPGHVEKIEGALRDAAAVGRVGLTVKEIAVDTGLLNGYVGVALCHSQKAVRKENKWYLMDAAPFQIHDLTREDILERVGCARKEMQFCAQIVRHLRDRAPASDDVASIISVANLNDCRKAYGMIGPLDTPDEAARKRLEAQKYLDAGRETSNDPVRPTDTWLFHVTREEAANQLAAGEKRRASYRNEVDWVSHNLDNRAAQPRNAPSNRAWTILVQAVRDQKTKEAFMDRINSIETKAKEQTAQQMREDDMRVQFKLLSAVENHLNADYTRKAAIEAAELEALEAEELEEVDA